MSYNQHADQAMGKKTRNDDVLDWTVTEAPAPDEPAPLPSHSPPSPPPDEPPATHSLKISRRLWLIAGGLIVASLLGLALFSAWDQYRVRRAVEQVVALEEQAALAGDADGLKQLYEASNPDWARRAASGQAAPLPMRWLRPVPEPGVVRSVETLTQDTVRADVARRFIAPDGSRVSFALPQFYHYANGEWKRIPPPTDFWGKLQEWSGKYIEIGYFAADEAFIADLGPYLDDVISRACAAWACPGDLQFTVDFLLADTSAFNAFSSFYYSPSPMDPFLFTVVLSSPTLTLNSSTLALASPHQAGYPADEASRELLRRGLALDLLARTANVQRDNAFAYALAARLGARLGLEAPEIANVYYAPTTFTAEMLWGMNYLGADGPLIVPLQQTELQQALAILNVLLRDQTPDVEDRLFRALPTADNPAAWLSEGLAVPPEEAEARLRAAMGNTESIQVQLPPAAHYRIAL